MEQKPYHWMVQQTAQKEWIIGRGIRLWLAFFFTEIGAGIYFVSIFLNFPQGWLLGWFISLVLGGFTHLLFLGKPVRAWRMLLKPLSSELSRGLLITVIYAGVGLFHVAPIIIPGLPWSGDNLFIRILMGALCVLLMTHGFLTMNFMKAIPLWNSPMMIPLSVISGIWVGSQIAQMLMVSLGLNIAAAEVWSRWSLLCFIMAIALFLWSAAHLSTTTRISVKGIFAGPVSFHFYVGVLLIGIIVPLMITLFVWQKDPNYFSAILFVRMACAIIGDVLMRYCILHRGMYRPIVKHNAISLHG
jgi:formate-dependent nitrite reductase membrane component NrfD